MRSPLAVWRDFSAEFSRVMREHEQFLLSELAPSPERVARARERRGAQPDPRPPGEHPAEGVNDANQ
ncbi:MAG: hypothetical protein ACQERF_05290 [Actinomycetota bacterium]